MEIDDVVKEIKKLEAFKGRHTELVSVYIPQGAALYPIIKRLEEEKSTATNIKSKATRKNVIEALEKIVRELRKLKKTPENGVAVFAGNVSKKEGQTDVQYFSVEPPVVLNVKLYRCDQKFLVEPLQEIVESRDKYGLLVIERKEATIGLLDGKNIVTLRKHTSGVPGKIKAGGSSAARFSRVIETRKQDY